MLLIKVGGGEFINWEGICQDVASLAQTKQIILVHGANVLRDKISARMSVPVRTVVSPSGFTSVYTDSEALDIFIMSYAGLANKKIVGMMQKHGVNAIGLSGVDGKLWRAKRKQNILIKEGGKTKLLRNNFTGRVEEINTDLLNLLLDHGYLPILCAPAISYENVIVNTDNDGAIAVMAKALNCKIMVSLFEAPGLLEDPENENTLITHIDREKIGDYITFAKDRMKKKILGAEKAIEGGVEIIYWGDGRVSSPILNVMNGNGTVIS